MKSLHILGVAVAVSGLAAAACGSSGPDASSLNDDPPATTGGMQSTTGGSSGSASTTGGAVSNPTAGSGGAPPSGGTGGASVGGGSTNAGTGGVTGTAGTATGGTGGGGGSGGSGEVGPYAPRSGSFKMMVYSRQGPNGYRHAGSIDTGKAMLADISKTYGFEIVSVETEADTAKYITPEGLAPFEIIFFLNSTSDIFNETQQQTYEDWMTQKNGAFAGVHSATDTENGWAFYSEVTGQYYNGHGNANTPDQIQLEAGMLDFPALKGIPNPWQRNEEWYKFNSWQQWSAKPGFKILGKKAADGQPIMWIREYGNFRSFYTAIGHDGAVFQDATVKKHVTGGLMWAVRREHLIQ